MDQSTEAESSSTDTAILKSSTKGTGGKGEPHLATATKMDDLQEGETIAAEASGSAQVNPRDRRIFGIPRQRTDQSGRGGVKTYDYEQKYPSDAIGMEMASSARVWLVYLDEAEEFDHEMIEGWRDTIDVLFVFAGLFSAVVTTFVVQTSQALQPNYAMITASLMTEMVSLQRAMLTGNVIDVPHLLDVNSMTTSRSDIWVNALWFASLSFALGAALLSVLVKQWLQHYVSALTGTPRERVVIRHFRFLGLGRWKLPFIIGFLPVLLHIALLLFFAGLVVFLAPMNTAVTIVVICIGGLSFIIYTVANILPLIFIDCPYKNPFSDYIYFFAQYLKFTVQQSWSWTKYFSRYQLPHVGAHIFSMKEREATYALTSIDILIAKALVWVDVVASNPTVSSVVTQSMAGLPAGFDNDARHLFCQGPNSFKQRVIKSLLSTVHSVNATPMTARLETTNLLMCSHLLRAAERLHGSRWKLWPPLTQRWDTCIPSSQPLKLYHDILLDGLHDSREHCHHPALATLQELLRLELPSGLWQDVMTRLVPPYTLPLDVGVTPGQEWVDVVSVVLDAAFHLLPSTQVQELVESATWDEGPMSLVEAAKRDIILNLSTLQFLAAQCPSQIPSHLNFDGSEMPKYQQQYLAAIAQILPCLHTIHNTIGSEGTAVYARIHNYLSIMLQHQIDAEGWCLYDPGVMKISLKLMTEVLDILALSETTTVESRSEVEPHLLGVVSHFTHIFESLWFPPSYQTLEYLVKYLLLAITSDLVPEKTPLCDLLSLLLLKDVTACRTLHANKGLLITVIKACPGHPELRDGLCAYIHQLEKDSHLHDLAEEDLLWLCRLFIIPDRQQIPAKLNLKHHKWAHRYLASVQFGNQLWSQVIAQLNDWLGNILSGPSSNFNGYLSMCHLLEEMKVVLGLDKEYPLFHHVRARDLCLFDIHPTGLDLNNAVRYVAVGPEPRLFRKVSADHFEVAYKYIQPIVENHKKDAIMLPIIKSQVSILSQPIRLWTKILKEIRAWSCGTAGNSLIFSRAPAYYPAETQSDETTPKKVEEAKARDKERKKEKIFI